LDGIFLDGVLLIVAQAGLKLPIFLPPSPKQLGLPAFTIMPSHSLFFIDFHIPKI
jgi:hypothetical protein